MHVVVRQDAVVIGVHQTVLAEYFLNFGVLEAMVQAHVHVTDVTISKVQAAVICIKNDYHCTRLPIYYVCSRCI